MKVVLPLGRLNRVQIKRAHLSVAQAKRAKGCLFFEKAKRFVSEASPAVPSELQPEIPLALSLNRVQVTGMAEGPAKC